MRGTFGSKGGMRARLCAAAVALAALGAPVVAHASEPPPGFFGMDTAVVPTQRAFNQMRANGVEVFRLAIQWPEVEPRPPMKVGGYEFHRYNWKRPDEQMRELVSAGLRPHLSLIGSPYWVASTYATSPMRSAAGRRSWPAFAAAVARRYGPGGTFWKLNPDLPVYTPGVYQIWNEENSQIAYAPKANPKQYAQLFELAAQRILQADPRVRVIPGGMFGTPQLEHSMYAWDFLGKFLKQPHIGAYVGGVAVHPYAKGLRGVKYQMTKMRKAAHDAGYGKLPFYVTEIGYSSEKPNGNVFYKGRGQAKAVKKTLGLLVHKRKKWHLKRVVWFTWSDLSHHASDVSGCGFCQKMGLVDKNLKPKPALKSWRHWALR